MGYRSDVQYVFYTRKPDTTPFSVIKLWFDENYPKHDFGEAMMGDDYIMVRYESIKWYPGYDEVEAVNRAVEIFTAAFEANDKDDVAWECVQIGEELSDLSHDGSPYCDYRLYVSREITFN